MGRIVDTTNIVDTSTCLNVNLEPNMISDNYYLSSIQDKINYEWEFRANKIDLKEEVKRGTQKYKDVQVAMDHVFDEKTKTTLSDDWRKIIFRDITHDIDIGKRFLIRNNFNEINGPESVWLLTNASKMTATAGGIIRRCNNNIAMKLKDGSIHYEPCVLETEFKSINLYYDESIVIPQSQIYMILQYNEYTKKIKINDRYILGATDLEDRSNNDIFKVNATVKFKTGTTFDVSDNKLVYVGLNRDAVDERDDLINRVAYQATSNIDPDDKPVVPDDPDVPIEDNYNVKLFNLDENKEIYEDKILLDEENNYKIIIYKNGEEIKDLSNFEINYISDLVGTDKDEFYYELSFDKDNKNIFSILNKRTYVKDKLQINILIKSKDMKEDIDKKYYFMLGGLS